ncbi:MAG: hypothetical protein H6Q72_2672 [Firmicutes bacterium]|nr:hypothetical protein [Bacillota bacterium]
MAAKIIAFPDQSVPNATEIENVIREWLSRLSEDQEFIDTVADRMMSFIMNYTDKWVEPTFDLVVPPTLSREDRKTLLESIEKGVDDTARQVQEMVNRIIIERFFLEVDMYQSRKKEPHLVLSGK